MKKRYIIPTMILLLVALALCACSATYRADIGAQVLTENIISALESQSGEYYLADGQTYAVYFDTEDAYSTVEDCCIAYHNEGTNVDQIGVFRVKEGHSTEPVRKMVQEYVDGQCEYLHGFASNYNQAELDKIQNQHVVVMGQYVYFGILSESDETVAMQTIKDAIAK